MAGKTFNINGQSVHGSTEMTPAQLKQVARIPAEKALYDADSGRRLEEDEPIGEVERVGAVQDWVEGKR